MPTEKPIEEGLRLLAIIIAERHLRQQPAKKTAPVTDTHEDDTYKKADNQDGKER